MRRAQIASKKAAREHQRLKREIAEHKENARSESEDRRKGIKALWDLDEQQLKAAKNPKERKLKEQELKAKKLKELVRSVRDSTGNDDLVDRVSELIELVGLQDREIEYLTQFRRDWERIQAYDPDILESLSFQSLLAQLRPPTDKLLAEEKPKQAWQRKRGDYKLRGGVGLIEYEFGGAGEADWRKRPLAGLSGLAYEPTCLDEIFAGGMVHMDNSEREVLVLLPQQQRDRILKPGLQLLFGMHRNRLPKDLTSFKNPRNRTERLYDYHAVTEIMEALLEKPSQCKRSARGRPLTLWLGDPDLRNRVRSGIEARIKRFASELWEIDSVKAQEWQKEIGDKFLSVIRRPPTDSAKK